VALSLHEYLMIGSNIITDNSSNYSKTSITLSQDYVDNDRKLVTEVSSNLNRNEKKTRSLFAQNQNPINYQGNLSNDHKNGKKPLCVNCNNTKCKESNRCFNSNVKDKGYSLSLSNSNDYLQNKHQSVNFSSKIPVLRLNSTKINQKCSKPMPELRSGDWNCKRCKNLNFGFRSTCNRCSFKQQTAEKSNTNMEIKVVGKAGEKNKSKMLNQKHKLKLKDDYEENSDIAFTNLLDSNSFSYFNN